LRVEHLQRTDQQQRAAADLERGDADAEELDDLQPGDGTDSDDDEGGERRDVDRAQALRGREVLREGDEKGTTPIGLTMASSAISGLSRSMPRA
jgi:hypothetical protein